MMRMVMTSPNVLRDRRPDWLAPFNFFFFPILSDVDGYPFGCDKTNFHFITPPETARNNWKNLHGINLLDGKPYQISMLADPKQRKVFPDSFQVILNHYLDKAEIKSLAPDGTACEPETAGVLRRAEIESRSIIPVGKETDRHWDQGEDPANLRISFLRSSGSALSPERMPSENGKNRTCRSIDSARHLCDGQDR